MRPLSTSSMAKATSPPSRQPSRHRADPPLRVRDAVRVGSRGSQRAISPSAQASTIAGTSPRAGGRSSTTPSVGGGSGIVSRTPSMRGPYPDRGIRVAPGSDRSARCRYGRGAPRVRRRRRDGGVPWLPPRMAADLPADRAAVPHVARRGDDAAHQAAGHPAGQQLERALGRRRRRGRGEGRAARGRGVPARAPEVRGPRRARAEGHPALRPAGHRQDAAGEGRRAREPRGVLLAVGVELRRDVRRRRRVAHPQAVRDGPQARARPSSSSTSWTRSAPSARATPSTASRTRRSTSCWSSWTASRRSRA